MIEGVLGVLRSRRAVLGPVLASLSALALSACAGGGGPQIVPPPPQQSAQMPLSTSGLPDVFMHLPAGVTLEKLDTPVSISTQSVDAAGRRGTRSDQLIQIGYTFSRQTPMGYNPFYYMNGWYTRVQHPHYWAQNFNSYRGFTEPTFTNDSELAYKGKPAAGQTCNNSKAVGDFVGLVNKNGVVQNELIAQINPIVVPASPTFYIINGVTVAINTKAWGWLYKDQDGHYWIQQNSALQPTFSAAFNAKLASFGINFPNDQSPHYAGTDAPQLPPGQTYVSCWPDSKGVA